MRSKYIKRAIDELGPWYQRYEMDGQWTTDSKISGETVWPDIRSIIDDDLEGMRILDLGANAGYYSIMLSLEGVEVTAVEPDPKYFKQLRWSQYYFEDKLEKKIPIKMLKTPAAELNFRKLGDFDYILALSVIHHIPKHQDIIVSKLCNAADKIVVTTRNDKATNSIGYYNKIFLENELYMVKKIIKKRPIMLYSNTSTWSRS